MKPDIDVFELGSGREVKNIKPSGWPTVVETGVVPGAGSGYTVELDNRILMNGTLQVKVDGDVMTVIPYGLTVGATEVGVSFDIPLLQFNSACDGKVVEVTYQPLGTQLSAGLVEEMVPAPVVKARGTVMVYSGDDEVELTPLPEGVTEGDTVVASIVGSGINIRVSTAIDIAGDKIAFYLSSPVSADTDVNWAVV